VAAASRWLPGMTWAYVLMVTIGLVWPRRAETTCTGTPLSSNVVAWQCLLWGIPHKRHTFAVRSLLQWYQAGDDVEARLPVLSTYLGHRDPRSTYWYYSDSRVIPISAPLPA
jgi:integrase